MSRDSRPADDDSIPCLKPFWQNKYKATATKNWDLFYKRNTTKFFKDRHWLDNEFPDLISRADMVGMEVGCGVGNLIFPVLERHPTLKLFACDFSSTAIDLVHRHEDYTQLSSSNRLEAFVADIAATTDETSALSEKVAAGSLDFITCIFVFSAIPPELHERALANLARLLKPGGRLLFRDYAEHDLAQVRFLTPERGTSEVPKLAHNLYVRQDGTLSYFFHPPAFRALVEAAPGLGVERCDVVERRTRNVKRGLDEARFFLQAVVTKV